MIRILALLLALALAGCPGAGVGLVPDRPSPPQTRLLPAPADEVRAAALAVLEEAGADPGGGEDENGRLRSSLIRIHLRQLDRRQIERIRRIADFEPARRLGMQAVSEIHIEHTIDVAAVEERSTRVEIVTELAAIDRSQAIFLGIGAVTVVPRRFPLRSRGVLEKELMLRIAQRVLLGEEMLYFLGELGKD